MDICQSCGDAISDDSVVSLRNEDNESEFCDMACLRDAQEEYELRKAGIL
jgi:hypothetical protein